MAREYDVDPLVVKSIVRVESNFKPAARNPTSSAAGLMQMTPEIYRLVWEQPDSLPSSVIERRLTTNNNAHGSAAKHAIETGVRYLANYAIPHATSRRNTFFNYHVGRSVLNCYQDSEECLSNRMCSVRAARYAKDCDDQYRTWAAELDYEFRGHKQRQRPAGEFVCGTVSRREAQSARDLDAIRERLDRVLKEIRDLDFSH
jgi:hypothetical protein